MKMNLNLSAIGQRVFIPVFGPRDQGSGLPDLIAAKIGLGIPHDEIKNSAHGSHIGML